MKWLSKYSTKNIRTSTFDVRRVVQNGCCSETEKVRWPDCTVLQHLGFGKSNMSFLFRPVSPYSLFELNGETGTLTRLANTSNFCRGFSQFAQEEHSLTRSWSIQLWNAKKQQRRHRQKKNHGISRQVQSGNTLFEALSSFGLSSSGSVLSRPVIDEEERQVKAPLNQPSVGQWDQPLSSLSSSEEVKLAPLLARANLVITRDVEWANIMFAFEQESRYIIMDPNYPQSPVGFIHEQSNVIFRQLLRTRRPFIAYIIDGLGNEIFRVRRPFWWINSTIYAEVEGKVVGVVHRRWHLWRRIYDLYLGNKQFAVVENPGFWNWTFTLKDDEENVLAQIDRDWRGFGFELFTDAGQYVIRFGDAGSNLKYGMASEVQELEVARPLSLAERAVTLALAVSLDTDYFSRRGGWGLPILIAGE